MNGAYIQGATPTARLSVAARSILELYYHDHPSHRYLGMVPDYAYFEQFMKPFVEQEDDLARLDERSNDDSPSSLARRRELTQRIKDRRSEIDRVLALYKKIR